VIVLKNYLVGIKGTGMSVLACMLYDLGHEVIGSDVLKNFGFEEGLLKEILRFLILI
jgi:UDP-N-acetylmuramate--alanine ligase